MHVEKYIRVCDWKKAGRSQVPIPVYCLADGKYNVPRPKPITKLEARRRYLARNARPKPKLGLWGL